MDDPYHPADDRPNYRWMIEHCADILNKLVPELGKMDELLTSPERLKAILLKKWLMEELSWSLAARQGENVMLRVTDKPQGGADGGVRSDGSRAECPWPGVQVQHAN